jgi:hypothetical protein
MARKDKRDKQVDEVDREAFDAFARTLGAVPLPVPESPRRANEVVEGQGQALSPEYRRMVRDAKAFFGDAVRERLTEMLVPYGVTDTHALAPRQCAEISEKIEILQMLQEAQVR